MVVRKTGAVELLKDTKKVRNAVVRLSSDKTGFRVLTPLTQGVSFGLSVTKSVWSQGCE